jgi:raffinose/stachyose/melibiose transport system permease protein
VKTDLATLLTTLYVHLDDRILPALSFSRDHHPGREPVLSDVELLCLIVTPTKALNSLLVTAGSVSFATISGAGAGYFAARIRPRWVGGAVTLIFAFGLFRTVQRVMVMLFVQMQQLGLIGTLWTIILIDTAAQLPLTVVIFSALFAALPEEIEEAAFVDGLGRIGVLLRIVVPIAKPAIATSVILGVVAVWNEFFVALIFATSPSLQTLPIGLAAFKGAFSTD